MDNSSRGSHTPATHYSGMQFGDEAPATDNNNGPAPASKGSRPGKQSPINKFKTQKWARFGVAAFGLLLLLIVVWLIIGIATSDKSDEADYVDASRMQAVFLQTGQVYFGDIKAITDNSIDLQNIFYLQTSEATEATSKTATANNNVSLVKLGCELHAPQDRMIINRDQVTFWENLNTDGQVAKAVKTFQDNNPNGQKCDTASTTNSSNVQGTTPTTNTTPTNNSTTKQ